MGVRALWFRNWDPLGTTVKLVDRWRPDPGLDSEKTAESSLLAFLTAELSGCRVSSQFAHDRGRADIVIESKVAIELKHGLATMAEYNRLVGQLEGYFEWGVLVVVVLTEPRDRDIVAKLRAHLERRFNEFETKASLVVKGESRSPSTGAEG